MGFRWSPAFRAVESSKQIFEELGNDEHRDQAADYLETLRQAAQESGYFEEQDRLRSRNPFQRQQQQQQMPQQQARDRYGPSKAGDNAGGALFNRKAFPWRGEQQ